VIWFHKASAWTLAALKPLGLWGLGGLSFVDSGLIPMPPDLLVMTYATQQPGKLVVYCLVAALGSALGSLIPYYVGRAGGELFLLKRINRQRYESLRDRFAKQEFLVIAIPAMIPPPFPLKVFEFAAGVFEMKPLLYAGAIFCGKFVRFLVLAGLTVRYGPTILHTSTRQVHEHFGTVLGVGAAMVGGVVFFVVRRVFARRRGVVLPVEDEPQG